MSEKEGSQDFNGSGTSDIDQELKNDPRSKPNTTIAPLSPSELQTLFSACISAKSHSYSPYSKFRVGCAVLLADNTIVTGCNVENITYGLTVCAERTAYLKAVSEGRCSFRAVAVNTDITDTLVLPCGQCRQFMWEFGDVDVYVVSSDLARHQRYRLSELLPGGMTMENLEEGQRNRPENGM